MSRMNNKKTARVGFRVDEELLERYQKKVSNVSDDLRDYMERKVNKTTSISELKLKVIEKEKAVETLELEIEELKMEISEQEELREANKQNNKLLNRCMETVLKVKENNPNKTISRDKVEEIANNKDLEPIVLIKACREQGIKFSSTKEESYNSRIVKSKIEVEKAPNDKLRTKILRDYKSANNKKGIGKFLESNEEKYKIFADRYKADYGEVKEELISKIDLKSKQCLND